jgi:hypothetical protein
MRNYPRLNFEAFDAARDRGLRLGFDIISPADMDRAMGIDPDRPPKLTPEFVRKIVAQDVEAVMASDAVALLEGWELSTGARAEKYLAEWLGLEILDAENFEPISVTPPSPERVGEHLVHHVIMNHMDAFCGNNKTHKTIVTWGGTSYEQLGTAAIRVVHGGEPAKRSEQP